MTLLLPKEGGGEEKATEICPDCTPPHPFSDPAAKPAALRPSIYIYIYIYYFTGSPAIIILGGWSLRRSDAETGGIRHPSHRRWLRCSSFHGLLTTPILPHPKSPSSSLHLMLLDGTEASTSPHTQWPPKLIDGYSLAMRVGGGPPALDVGRDGKWRRRPCKRNSLTLEMPSCQEPYITRSSRIIILVKRGRKNNLFGFGSPLTGTILPSPLLSPRVEDTPASL